jgi:hypothetical protein
MGTVNMFSTGGNAEVQRFFRPANHILSTNLFFFFFFFFLDEFILNRSSKLSTKPVEPYERTLHRYTRYGLSNARLGKHNKSEKQGIHV